MFFTNIIEMEQGGETKTPTRRMEQGGETKTPTRRSLLLLRRSSSTKPEWWLSNDTSLVFPRNEVFSNDDGEQHQRLSPLGAVVRENVTKSQVTELKLHLQERNATPLTLECAKDRFVTLHNCPQITWLDYWSYSEKLPDGTLLWNRQLSDVIDCFVKEKAMNNLIHLDLKLNIPAKEYTGQLRLPVSSLITHLRDAPNLTKFYLRIDFGFEDVDDEINHARDLAETLPRSKIKDFRLRSDTLSDNGVRLISECIKAMNCPLLTAFHLHGDMITDKGVKFLADALVSSAIVELDLTSTKITNLGAWYLSKRSNVPSFGDVSAISQLETLHFPSPLPCSPLKHCSNGISLSMCSLQQIY